MRKTKTVVLGLMAVIALGAFSATPAFAAPQFLVAGVEIAAALGLEMSGELLLEDENAPGAPAVLCNISITGTIEVGGALGLVEALLVGGELLEGAEGSDLIECLTEKGSCAEITDVEAHHLPWHIEVELDTTPGDAYLLDFLSEAGKVPFFEIDCETLIGLVEDRCEGLTSARLFISLEAGTLGHLLASFNQLLLAEPFGAESPLLTCSIGGATGLVETPEDTEKNAALLTSPGGLLTVSE